MSSEMRFGVADVSVGSLDGRVLLKVAHGELSVTAAINPARARRVAAALVKFAEKAANAAQPVDHAAVDPLRTFFKS